jgi:molybdenum cofactor cytidylyltransferase
MAPVIAAVLLAAGGSTRLGRPKLLAAVPGGTLLGLAARALLASVSDRVVVVLGAAAADARAVLPADPRLQVVENAAWEEGLASSIRAGVAAADDCDAVLLALADQPGLDAVRVDAVVRAWDARAPLVLPVWDGRGSHPVLVARALFAELQALRGDVGARDVVRRHRPAAIEVSLPPLADVDTEAQYRALLEGRLAGADGLPLDE